MIRSLHIKKNNLKRILWESHFIDNNILTIKQNNILHLLIMIIMFILKRFGHVKMIDNFFESL